MEKSRILRQSASALRDLFGPSREISLEELCGEPCAADEDRCDGCRLAVPLVTRTASSTADSRRRYCAECARLMAGTKPIPPEYA